MLYLSSRSYSLTNTHVQINDNSQAASSEPVLETTRHVLLAKLEKHLISDLPPENVGDSSFEKLLETPAVAAVKSPRNQTNTTNDSTATEVTNGSLSFNSPAQKSSPILEYASRLPSYRRRSIHPERPDLTNPYTDLILPDSVTLLSSRPYSPSDKATPWKRTAGSEKWSVTKKIKDLRSPVSRSVVALINAVRALIVATLKRESTDCKVRGSNPTSASRLPLSRLRQPDSISALVLPPGGMAARHWVLQLNGLLFSIWLITSRCHMPP
ncbi:hypothetical protein T265_09767 [Opisthorchis viverrini]|uniref:Uncharacterized protein n=1 Tax=Opisthorchis viverrini TaxID=6198 RepID=A0A074Z8Y6_OPIVI|nr:hypothetical protein T265_09767 [Opisthorchis viverrini]KER22052.1 hypothetical protein T265_09767 [Opisthorchis viverrini]